MPYTCISPKLSHVLLKQSEQQTMVTALSTKEDAHTDDDNQNKIAQLFISVIHTDPRVQLSETQRLIPG